MVRNIGVLPKVGSLPAYVQVKGCIDSLQRAACPDSCSPGSSELTLPTHGPTAASAQAYAAPPERRP